MPVTFTRTGVVSVTASLAISNSSLALIDSQSGLSKPNPNVSVWASGQYCFRGIVSPFVAKTGYIVVFVFLASGR